MPNTSKSGDHVRRNSAAGWGTHELLSRDSACGPLFSHKSAIKPFPIRRVNHYSISGRGGCSR